MLKRSERDFTGGSDLRLSTVWESEGKRHCRRLFQFQIREAKQIASRINKVKCVSRHAVPDLRKPETERPEKWDRLSCLHKGRDECSDQRGPQVL